MNSFEIIGSGISLDVANGSKLTTEFVATTFNESAVFAGSYSYPITFPFTAKNIDFFEHAHHLENRSARQAKEIVIVLFGMAWKTAKLEYSITRKGFEGTLKVDNGAVADWMRDVALPNVFSSDNDGKLVHTSIDIGSNATETQAHILGSIANINGYVWPTYLNSNAEGILKSGDAALINDFNNMTSLVDNRLYSPHFFHTWIIQKICNWMGYKAVGSYLDDQFIQSLVIFNTGLRTGADWKNQKKINPAEHLPNVKIAEYFKIIRNDHRVMIYFDSLTKIAHFELCNVLLEADNRLDLRNAIHYDSLEIQSQNENAFKLITKIDDNDELYKNVQYEKSVSVGYDFTNIKDLPLGIGRLHTSTGLALKGAVNVTIPAVQQISNIYSESYNVEDFEAVYNGGNVISKNIFALRMMSYKGLQGLGAGNHLVPFCTGNDKGNNGLIYTNSLDQGGASGFINQYTLQYYRFYCASEQVNIVVQMNAIDFFNIHPL